jgi:xanthine dehydrogenase YagT iron-sulfur-binding subunit
MEANEDKPPDSSAVSRREFVGIAVGGGLASAGGATAVEQTAGAPPQVSCTLSINGQRHEFQLDPRVTLLDLLREHLQLTGTKKGCDHGQCGACTVLVNNRRINSCLTLAVMHDGDQITTIEGLAQGAKLHPLQAAFIEHDGFQCGYCTPGQICSAVALMDEWQSGAPSAVTPNIAVMQPVELSDDEIRERMSGNLCRCGAYVGIVDAIRSVAKGKNA